MTHSAIPSHVACPACQQVTPLPSQTALTAVVRCPHCRAQFALQDLLVDPEVTWQLVSDTEQERSASTLAGKLTVQEATDEDSLHNRDADGRSARTVVEDVKQATGEDTYFDDTHYAAIAPEQAPRAVSPGAETVEMPGYEAFLEDGYNTETAEELFEPSADVVFDGGQDVYLQPQRQEQQLPQDFDESQSIVDSTDDPAVNPNAIFADHGQARKLEGPLVGEFFDDPEPEVEYPGESAWRSAAERAATDGKQPYASAAVGELGEESGFQSFSNGPAVRRRPPRRSPVWSMLQVALGGLAAVPVSLLLMWHLLGTDIAGAAPWVAQYAPWIVPQKFHAYAPTSTITANSLGSGSIADLSTSQPRLPAPGLTISEADTADETPTAQPQTLSDLELTTTDSLAGDAQADDSISPADTLVKSGRSDDVRRSSQNDAAEIVDSELATDNPADGYELDGTSLAGVLDGLEPFDAGRESDNPDASASPAGENLTNDATQGPPDDLDSVALENCFTSIRESDSMLEEWSLAVNAKRHDTTLAQDTYGKLASLALAIDELPSRVLVQQAMRGQLRPVREQVEQKLEVRNLIDQGARFWVRSQSQQPRQSGPGSTAASSPAPSVSAPYGLALTAVVDTIAPSDDSQWSMVTASATTQSGSAAKLPLDLRISQDLIDLLPEGKLSVGQKLFLLGTASGPTADAAAATNTVPEKPLVIANYLAPL